jgi:hypothetical protein
MLSQLHSPDGEFKVRIKIVDREFEATATRCREAEQPHAGSVWFASGLAFTSIDDADADFIEKFVAEATGETEHLETVKHPSVAPKKPTAEQDEATQRKTPRKAKPFYIAFSVNEVLFVPAYGLDIGTDGLRILTDVPMPDEFKVRVMLEERNFVVTVRKSWDKQVDKDGKTHWITGCRFFEIGPIDREFIRCYVSGEKFIEHSALTAALDELRKRPDRADLLLPREMLDYFLKKLIELNRLAPLASQANPLVRYQYEGKRRVGSAPMHLLRIDSRRAHDDTMDRFTTRFIFDENGGNIRMV